MAKIIALDIGEKRTGIAETDSLQIVAFPLEVVETARLVDFLTQHRQQENFNTVVVGDPIGLDGGDSDNSARVRKWVKNLKKAFPDIEFVMEDERFSSRIAVDQMVKSGMKKSRRRQKGEIDKMSAAVILRSFLDRGR